MYGWQCKLNRPTGVEKSENKVACVDVTSPAKAAI